MEGLLALQTMLEAERADALRDRDSIEAALDISESYLKALPSTLTVDRHRELAHSAWFLFLLERNDEACVRLRRLDLLAGESEVLQASSFAEYVRGRLLLAGGDTSKAIHAFELAESFARSRSPGISTIDTWRALWGLAHVAHLQGDLKKAASLFEDAVDEMLAVNRVASGDSAPFLGSKRIFIEEAAEILTGSGFIANAYRLVLSLDRLVLEPHVLAADVSLRSQAGVVQVRDAKDCLAPEERQQPQLDRTEGWRELEFPDLADDEVFVAVAGSSVFIQEGANVRFAEFDQDRPLAAVEELPARHLYISANKNWDKGKLIFADGARLLERHTVSLVPHPEVLTRPAVDAARGARFAVFGSGSNFGPQIENAERRMADRVGLDKHMGGEMPELKAWQPLDTLLFSGHGELDTGSLWDSRLMLAPDRPLTLADWLEARVPVRLAILSACTTASPTREASGHWFGFAEGMLEAGTDTVLAAWGEVGTDEALRFVGRFLDEGGLEAPAEAYRTTVRALEAKGDPAARRFLLFGRRGARRTAGDPTPD